MSNWLLGPVYLFWDKRGPGFGSKSILALISSLGLLLVFFSLPEDDWLSFAKFLTFSTAIISIAAIFWGVRIGQVSGFIFLSLFLFWRRSFEVEDPLALVLDLCSVLFVGFVVVAFSEWFIRCPAQFVRRILLSTIRPKKINEETKTEFPWRKAILIAALVFVLVFLVDSRLTVFFFVGIFCFVVFGWLLWQQETDDVQLDLVKVKDRLPIVAVRETRLGDHSVGEVVDQGQNVWRMVLVEIIQPARAEQKTAEVRQRELFEFLASLSGLYKIGAFSPFHLICQTVQGEDKESGQETKSELVFLVYKACEDTENVLQKYALELNWRLTHLGKNEIIAYLRSIFSQQDVLETLGLARAGKISPELLPAALSFDSMIEARMIGGKACLGILEIPAVGEQEITGTVLDAVWSVAQKVGGRAHLLVTPLDREWARETVRARRLAQGFFGNPQKRQLLKKTEELLTFGDPRKIRQCLFEVRVFIEISGSNATKVQKKLTLAQSALGNQRIASRWLKDDELELGLHLVLPVGFASSDFNLRQWLVGRVLLKSFVLSQEIVDYLFDILGADTRLIQQELPGEASGLKTIEAGFLCGFGARTFRPAFFDFVRQLPPLTIIDGSLGSGKSAFLGRILIGLLTGGYKGVVVDLEISKYFEQLLVEFAPLYKRTFTILRPPKKKERKHGWEDPFRERVHESLHDSEKIVLYQPSGGSLLTEDIAFQIFVEELLTFVNERGGDAEPIMVLADELDRLTMRALSDAEKKTARLWINIIDSCRKHNTKLVVTTHSLSDLGETDESGLGERILGEAGKSVFFLNATGEKPAALSRLGLSVSLQAIILDTVNVPGLSKQLADELSDRKWVGRGSKVGDFVWVILESEANEFLMGCLMLSLKEKEIKEREGLPVVRGGLPRLLSE